MRGPASAPHGDRRRDRGHRDLRRRPSRSAERVARAAADISLPPGEYAASPGDERALFAVLAGRIEAVRIDDGIETVVGERLPGDVFGEVPITLGTVFPVGFRAAEPSRVMRIEPRDYHAVRPPRPTSRSRSAGSPPTGWAAPAASRASPRSRARPRAIVIGHRWDAACTELRRFLDRNQIVYRWLQPDIPEDAEQWWGALPAEGDYPALRVVDGKTVVRPQPRRVAELLGLATEPDAAEYDAVIVGAGPAGLAAAVYGASEGLRVVAVEREAPGRPGGHLVPDRELPRLPVRRVRRRPRRSKALQQARRLGAEILVTRVDHADRRRVAPCAPRRRRRPPRAHDHPRVRRHLAAARDRRLRPPLGARASSTAPPAATRRTRTASTSTSSARATPPARRRSSSRPMPGA